jgi:hypothetical protein
MMERAAPKSIIPLLLTSVINNQSNVFQQQPSDALIVGNSVIGKDVINGKDFIIGRKDVIEEVGEK